MSVLFIQFLTCCSILVVGIIGSSEDAPYRPEFHFSAYSGFTNDPNCLIYKNGRYHMFYQYSPGAEDPHPGQVHWGHTWSTDLLRWNRSLPVAIYPDAKGDIFSGSCVKRENGSIVAIFSQNLNGAQDQAIAYSNDEGITFEKGENNTVLKHTFSKDFRDPFVIDSTKLSLSEPYKSQIMCLAVNDRIQFFGSDKNLKDWEWLSDFGVNPIEGDKCDVMECPSLFPLTDEQNNTHDILFSSENGENCGSRVQYFVGEFNGTHFRSYNQSRIQFIDGPDSYATVPYIDAPNGEIIFMTWANNWKYAVKIPTGKIRGTYGIPRRVFARNINNQLYVVEQPIDAVNTLVDKSWSAPVPFIIKANQTVDLKRDLGMPINSKRLRVTYSFRIDGDVSGAFGIQFSNNRGEYITIYTSYENGKEIITLDRSHSGDVSFHENFADLYHIERIVKSNVQSGIVVVDGSILEFFADDGSVVITSQFFPTEPLTNVQVYCENNNENTSATILKLKVDELIALF